MTERWYSNVPVSRPVEHTDEQGSFNGFAWHPRKGIVVERGDGAKQVVEALKALREKP